jgi:hypothetical protein
LEERFKKVKKVWLDIVDSFLMVAVDFAGVQGPLGNRMGFLYATEPTGFKRVTVEEIWHSVSFD